MHKAADELREAFRTLIRLHAKHGTIKVTGCCKTVMSPENSTESACVLCCPSDGAAATRAQLNEDEDYEPAELWKLGPRDLSFWIASNFRENPQHQQVLLQVGGWQQAPFLHAINAPLRSAQSC